MLDLLDGPLRLATRPTHTAITIRTDPLRLAADPLRHPTVSSTPCRTRTDRCRPAVANCQYLSTTRTLSHLLRLTDHLSHRCTLRSRLISGRLRRHTRQATPRATSRSIRRKLPLKGTTNTKHPISRTVRPPVLPVATTSTHLLRDTTHLDRTATSRLTRKGSTRSTRTLAIHLPSRRLSNTRPRISKVNTPMVATTESAATTKREVKKLVNTPDPPRPFRRISTMPFGTSLRLRRTIRVKALAAAMGPTRSGSPRHRRGAPRSPSLLCSDPRLCLLALDPPERYPPRRKERRTRPSRTLTTRLKANRRQTRV